MDDIFKKYICKECHKNNPNLLKIHEENNRLYKQETYCFCKYIEYLKNIKNCKKMRKK